MSLDARYLFVYESHQYMGEHPYIKDRDYLQDKYGGDFFIFDCGNTMFWDKPKYTLSSEEFSNLHADQILERKDCEMWEIVK